MSSHLFEYHILKKHPQIIYFLQCFFDTPGLIMKKYGLPKPDMKVRVESAWSSIDLYDILVVIFDVDRHLTRFFFYYYTFSYLFLMSYTYMCMYLFMCMYICVYTI